MKYPKLPDSVPDGNSIISYYLTDNDQKHAMHASIEHCCGSHEKKTVGISADAWLLPDSFNTENMENKGM